MKSTTEADSSTTVATRIAGEDIKPADFISVLTEIVELPSFLWCGSGVTLTPDEPVRTCYLPKNAGQPFRVVTVCLPFVYAERAKGGLIVFDVRQQQLVRLDSESGRTVWKRMRGVLKKEKSRS